jgi:hypothetical protein
MSTIEKQTNRSAGLKAELLSHGVVPTESFLDMYGPPFLEKRRAYGNPDDVNYRVHTIPQELYILPERLICAVNIRRNSPWYLDWTKEDSYFVYNKGRPEQRAHVSFPLRPKFYDRTLTEGEPVQNFVTLYGGGSLGVFVNGRCSFNDVGQTCGFCSLAPNRSRQTEFPEILKAHQVRQALQYALEDNETPITQVMINGGNFRDMDNGFLYYVEIVRETRGAINSVGRDVELHLIVGPPRNLKLLKRLKDLNVSVAINLEVHDPDLFIQYCPGKHNVFGRDHVERALMACVDHLGPGHVYSIFVGGLEPVDSLATGMLHIAESGITPIVNVFHPDPDTSLANTPSPSPSEIIEMGRSLQAIFLKFSFAKPFYLDCGRNSIDTEAYYELFT